LYKSTTPTKELDERFSECQEIFYIEPISHFSPPFGEITVIKGN